MSDKEEDCKPITSRQFNKISDEMSKKMVDRICSNIADDSNGKDPLSTKLKYTLVEEVNNIIKSDEGKQKLQSTVFETIKSALNSSRRNPILLYSLLKNKQLYSEVRTLIMSLFTRVYKNNKKIGSFSSSLLKIIRDPPRDLYDTKKTGGNKTRARKNKSRKRATRSLRKKQRGGGDPFDRPIISQDCSKCPENKELDDLINGYKDKLVSEMAKNIESDKHDIMERLLNAVRIYTRKNGKFILKSIIDGISNTIIPSDIDITSKRIIFLQALHAAREEVNLAIHKTSAHFNKEYKDKINGYSFNPAKDEFLDKFMEIITNTISKHYG
jgi:hypothetical protein